jgi:HEAT repeat protein
MDLKENPIITVSSGGAVLDPKAFEKIRDLLHHLANTVSAMKIFPSEHATIRTFIDDLSQKILGFLDAYGKLEISIEEFSFVCGDKPVYTDEMAIKSLPFFFFKDGMQKLYFYQGLDREEILDFLDLIKKESKKPAGEGDTITALWEKDFAHIQYFAPDEFLENRILQECGYSHSGGSQTPSQGSDAGEFSHKAIEIKVDTSKFTTGKIELSPEDREIVRERAALKSLAEEDDPRIALDKVADSRGSGELRRGFGPGKPSASRKLEVHDQPHRQGGEEEMADRPEKEPRPSADKIMPKEIGESLRSPIAAVDLTMTEPEIFNIEALLSSSRSISPDEEFLNLMAEILNLEKGSENFSSTLEILMEYHLDQLLQGSFSFSVLLVHKLRELKGVLSAGNPEKSAQLDAFLKKMGSAKSLDVIKGLLGKDQHVDWDGLVEFLKLLGNPALPLAADIFESVPDPESQKKMLDFIRTMSAQDPGNLASLAADERPLLSKALIGILARDVGKKGLPHFAVFLGFKNKDIKLDVIRALGQFQDEMANRILLGFLNDKDEDLRIQAAMKLNPVEETSKIQHLIGEAGSRAFKSKSLKEKQAILSFIGRTRTEEALAFLRRTLGKKVLWMATGTKEMKLAAVAGLESMGTEEAVRTLEKGAGFRNREVREACSQALVRLAQSKLVTRESER